MQQKSTSTPKFIQCIRKREVIDGVRSGGGKVLLNVHQIVAIHPWDGGSIVFVVGGDSGVFTTEDSYSSILRRLGYGGD